ncbi:MAG: hypothetical protein LQ350_006211 [Teloschistes chrysophthalmus]|nr:MAG: hypothetical protein LQ350_006211 [Niorma chrysophthalma]
MDTDELYEGCIATFRRLGVGNEEEVQDLTERYIRENTYLSDKRGQEEQILEIWHRCRADIQSTPAARQAATGSRSAGPSTAAPARRAVSSPEIAVTQAAASPVPRPNAPAASTAVPGATSSVSRTHPAIVVTSATPGPASRGGEASTRTIAASTPAEAGPSSMPPPSRPRSHLNPEVPSFYPWSYLGLPIKPTAPHLLPKDVQKANYQLRLAHDNQVIGALDRRIAAAQGQINQLKAAQDRHYADIQADFDFVQANGLDTATGVGRQKMLHATWCNEQADKRAEELKKKMDEKVKLEAEREGKIENLYPKDGEMGPNE